MNEALVFLNGVSVASAIILMLHNWQISRKMDRKQAMVGQEFTDACSRLSEAHNKVNASLAEIDRKATDAKIKIESYMVDRKLAANVHL